MLLAIAATAIIKEQTGDSDAVVVVGGEEVPYSYLEKRIGPFLRGDGSLSPEQFSSILSGILAEVEQEKLLAHIARERGIDGQRRRAGHGDARGSRRCGRRTEGGLCYRAPRGSY